MWGSPVTGKLLGPVCCWKARSTWSPTQCSRTSMGLSSPQLVPLAQRVCLALRQALWGTCSPPGGAGGSRPVAKPVSWSSTAQAPPALRSGSCIPSRRVPLSTLPRLPQLGHLPPGLRGPTWWSCPALGPRACVAGVFVTEVTCLGPACPPTQYTRVDTRAHRAETATRVTAPRSQVPHWIPVR